MSASCTPQGGWVTDVIDIARARLDDVSDRLALVQCRADQLIAQTAWQSDSARLFRAMAGHWRDDLRRLESDADRLCEDLGRTRTAVIERSLWGCE